MKSRYALELIATCALLMGTTVTFSHENTKQADSRPALVVKEQKDWGIAGDAKSATRNITLSMGDNMRFTPDKLSFKQGETVRFVVQNKGKMLHELVIGNRQELEAHAAMMLKFPAMEHDEPYMAHVPAGKAGDLVWTFNRPGEFDFACLIAGHYQAGMVGKITVTAAR
jgi:uncharacterized cupredoxin-like copper-binding protein